MTRYLAGRLGEAALTLGGVLLLTFALFRLLPTADPALLRTGRSPSPELLAAVRHDLGLDLPWYAQLGDYCRRLVTQLDLGYSYLNDEPVRSEILARLPATLSLTAGAAILWLVLGVALGLVAALRAGSWTDRLIVGGALAGLSAPVYWIALLALYLFADDIGLIPLLPGASTYVGITADPLRWAASLVLPWCVLALGFAAAYARLVRGTVREVFAEDFIRTARAKGLPERRVVRHALRASAGPVVTLAGMDVATLLGGAVLTETVFDIPGIGRYAFDAIQRGDLPVIEGVVLFGTLAVVVTSFAVDALYALLDPRVAAARRR